MKVINSVVFVKKLTRLLWLLPLAACATPFDKPATGTERSVDVPILDFRQDVWRKATTAIESPDSTRIKQAVYGSGYPESLHVGEAVFGSFTLADKQEYIHLLTRPESNNAMLAIFAEEAVNNVGNEDLTQRLQTQFVTDEPYHSVVSVLDLNGDLLNDLMLVQYDYHMGVLIASVDTVALIDGKLQVLDTQEFVLQDSCESTLQLRVIKASAFWFDGEQLVRREYIAPCVDADAQVKQQPVFEQQFN